MKPTYRDLLGAACIVAALYLLMLGACHLAALLYPLTPNA